MYVSACLNFKQSRKKINCRISVLKVLYHVTPAGLTVSNNNNANNETNKQSSFDSGHVDLTR